MRNSAHTTQLAGLGTALPPYATPQAEIAGFLSRVVEAQPDAPPRFVRYVEALSRRSGIETRYSVLPDYQCKTPDDFTFYPKNWRLDPFPTTHDRMRVYETASVSLAEAAAKAALTDAGVEAESITHLILTTCTGFFAPGPDVILMERLSLRPTLQRLQIGFMGCYAGINGMRAADRIVRADPEAVVLQISVELCSLHYQRAPRLEYLIPNLLFADGAAAAVYQGTERGLGKARVASTRSTLVPDTQAHMSWDIGDHGFVMTLADAVPGVLGAQAGPFVDGLVHDAGVTRSDVRGWALHPGGKRIVHAVAKALSLDEAQVAPALNVLSRVGNLSSATILFVVEEVLSQGTVGPVLAMGFGPGLTMEGVVLVAR